jgi:hypothetical protein
LVAGPSFLQGSEQRRDAGLLHRLVEVGAELRVRRESVERGVDPEDQADDAAARR